MSARCRCSHDKSAHSMRTGGCRNDVCGCRDYRPDDGQRWTPARLDERYDPSPYGIQRRTA